MRPPVWNLSYKFPPLLKCSQLHRLMRLKKYHTVVQNVVRRGACHGRSEKQDVAKAPKSWRGGRSPRFACGGIRRKCYPTRGKIGRPCFEGKKEIPVEAN